MAIFNRISAIKMRMQEIQSKFGASPTSFVPIKKTGAQTVGLAQGAEGTKGITFEDLLATKMNGTENLGSVNHVKSAKIDAKASDFDSIIKEASQKYDVDENFIKSIIQQESGFNPNAKSWVGAMGLMQLMPGTAKDLGVKNAYDPRENIMGGVKYIKQQLDRFSGDKRKALAAYNAGPGAVMKYGGIPPYSETQNYVKNIMATYNSMNKL